MKKKSQGPLGSVALVSVPWPLYSRPSIQIGTLKAYLKLRFPDLNITAHHFYLKVAEAIGYTLYHAVSKRTWPAETVYAALLYPERFKTIEKIFYRETSGNRSLRGIDFRDLTDRVRVVSEAFIRDGAWGSFGLAGFSISSCQLTASLFFIRKIKMRYPDLRIVIGGSVIPMDSTRNFFNLFPEIDAVVFGEGELPLGRLVDCLTEPSGTAGIDSIPGVVAQTSGIAERSKAFNQVADLTGLNPPDYDDYFELLKTFSPEKSFFPTLPVETSRGCWWRRKNSDGNYSGCAFCNLNLQWSGYRTKTPQQVVSEIDHLTTKHKVLSLAVTDNLLPAKTSEVVFKQLYRLNKDLRIFGEIRATTPGRVLTTMRAGGMNEVQIGIEALSTRLLGKLNKGTTAIQNLEIMKDCEARGIANASNLILCFPGSDQQDVAETLRNLEFAWSFQPLKAVRFWLGFGSPVWQDPRAFGIKAVFNHPNYAGIFPAEVFRSTRFIVQSYRGDLVYQKKLWRPVKKRLETWKKEYAELHKGSGNTPILSFRDGRDFLIIRQKRFNDAPLTHRLEGTSRSIYLFCQRNRAIQNIVDRFPEIRGDKIVSFVNMMVDKKLMFEEGERCLSLAVPITGTFHENF